MPATTIVVLGKDCPLRQSIADCLAGERPSWIVQVADPDRERGQIGSVLRSTEGRRVVLDTSPVDGRGILRTLMSSAPTGVPFLFTATPQIAVGTRRNRWRGRLGR